MRRFSIVLAILFLLTAGSYVLSALTPSNQTELTPCEKQSATKITVMNNVTSMPLTFTKNQGQWDDKVLYRADAGHATAWFTEKGVTYQFTRQLNEQNNFDPSVPSIGIQPQEIIYEQMTLKVKFENANSNPKIISEKQLDYKCNYFLGDDPTKWRTNVPSFETIVYEEIYSGIDLKYYGNTKRMEYDFVVAPGADPSQIQVHYEGANSLSVDDEGQLAIETEWGTIIEHRPVVYQVINSERHTIAGEYVILGESSFGFKLTDDYDPQLALVIDPEIGFSTYLGGAGDDYVQGIDIDAGGSAVVSGPTYSSDFPKTAEALDTLYNGDCDMYITKFTPAGNDLVYSTFLGGTAYDNSWGMELDESGNVYLAGWTTSSNFPTTDDAYDDSYNSHDDIFVTKLAATGDSLIYSTYLGGSNNRDLAYGITVDKEGCAYVAGLTLCSDFPIVRAYDEIFNPSNDWETCVTKLSPAGDSIIYSTFLGGNVVDQPRDIATDDDGCVYIVGQTNSADFPTVNPYDGNVNDWDLFVSKLSASGDTLLYSTYLGGSNREAGDYWNRSGIEVDEKGLVYIGGWTRSSNFPTTPDAYDPTWNGGYIGAFMTILAPQIGGSGSLIYSTYLMASYHDGALDIALDTNGNVYLTGLTYDWTYDFPVIHAIDATHNGYYDVFVSKLVPAISGANGLVFSTFLGGSGRDHGFKIALDNNNNIYVGGYTTSSAGFPLVTPYDNIYAGGNEAFLTKIEIFTADYTGIAVNATSGIYDTIKVAYSGGTGAVTGLVYYRLGGEVSYTSGALQTGIGDSLYYPFIPNDTMPATRALEYYLELTRDGYIERVGGPLKPMVYAPLLTNVQAQRPEETEAGRYRIIGVPINVAGDSSCRAVFPDDLGGNYKSSWRLASYDGTTHAYAEYASSAPVLPGQGYWLTTRAKARYGAVGWPVQPNRIHNSMYFYEVALDSGWNLLANPFSFDVSVQEILIDTNGVVVSGWPITIVDPTAHWYSGTQYVGVLTIPAWDGFFVNIKRHGVTALFPYHEEGTTKKLLPLASSYPGETGPGDWQIHLQMKANGCIDDGNFAGVRSDALEGLDRFDYGEPPPPPGGPSLAFKSNETDNYLKRCDFRPPFDDGAEWYLTFTEVPGRTLSIGDIEQIPNNMSVWLILDDDSKMKLEEESVIDLPDDVLSARLLIGEKDYLRDNGSITMPRSFALEQNYPNPFNPITVINFSLPEPSAVNLDVYNLLGRKVTTLTNRDMPAGNYSVIWDGTDNSGQPVASGVYLYTIKAGNFKSSKKMILLK